MATVANTIWNWRRDARDWEYSGILPLRYETGKRKKIEGAVFLVETPAQ